MKRDQPKIAEQCHLVCGTKVIHLRILNDGEAHQYDLHALWLTSWRIVCRSAPALRLSLEAARDLVEEQARITCGRDSLKFHWATPTSAPRPSGRVKEHSES